MSWFNKFKLNNTDRNKIYSEIKELLLKLVEKK